jgi:uncharacterized repeat protein (TIGR01451 family)
MIAANSPRRLMFGQSRVISRIKSAGSPRTAALLILFGLLATTIYLPSSASVSRFSSFAGVRIGVAGATKGLAVRGDLGIPAISGSSAVRGLMALVMPQTGTESIVVSPPATRAPGCNDPNLLCLGETVTATVSNAPLRAGFRERRIVWVAPDGSVPQVVDVITDPQTDTYTLPTNGSFAQVGTWEVRTINNRGGGVVITPFEVGDPTQPSTDLAITVTGPTSVTANTNASYNVTITNNGPDTADNVTLFNPVPYNSTFVSASGPENFPCTTPAAGQVGDINCATASLALNASAAFTFVFSVNSDVKNGSAVYEWAKTETSTNEPDKSNNISDIYASSAPPGGGGGTCTLDCPEDVNAVANTTEGGQRGAHVSFPPTTSVGDCGTVTTTPASGDFFPVGTTTVTSTSELNGGSCSFTVTVEDQGTNPPTITCPGNKTANADSSVCFVSVAVGTATATGNNVTIFATRSDGKPMYTCDANGTNCVRRSSDDPFAAGITTITWIAHSHDIAGPYADADDEEAHRTGAASCTQTVTVNDVTPPVITATDQTVSADANCQASVPDYSDSATDNCACSSTNTSETCQDRERIVVTQDLAAGTLVGPGVYTIHLSANDGSSNPNAGPDGIPGTSDDGTGNITNKTITFTVNDTTAPVISCPASITTSNDAGQCSATVNPGTATATDNCDSTPTITGTRSDSQPLTAPYPKGTTTITWRATDDAGNYSECTQTVTVNDTENPTISCPGNITKNNDPGQCSAVVTYTAPVGSDNCPGATTAQTAGLPSGSTFPVGTTTNTFEVTDSSGNKTSCSFTVTVNDVENPVISCPASQTLEPTCPSGAVATWTAPVGTDNCPGAVTTRTGPAPGSVFPIGTTTVTYTVNDAHGHSASCSFTVTVKTVNQTIEDLKTSVNNSSLSPSNKGGLVSKLQAAQDALAAGHTNTACQKLADFINSVQNLISHGDISAAQGNAWISTASHIRNTLGCTNNPCT